MGAPQTGQSASRLDRSVFVLAGTVQQVVEHLEAVREETGISYVSIRSDQIEEFAPVVATLHGR